MIDYNDGLWHGWNGGECPVHPKSIVHAVRGKDQNVDAVVWSAGAFQPSCWADLEKSWSIIAFRVVKVHREPREYWIVGARVFGDEIAAKHADMGSEMIHVREVME